MKFRLVMVTVILSTAAYVGLTPRSAQQVGIPVPTVIPATVEAPTLREFVSGNRAAQTGAPRPTARPSERPRASVATTPASPRVRPTPSGGHRPAVAPLAVSARATWYCGPGSRCTVGHPAGCLCAAISPDLSSWMGAVVRVRYGSRSVDVRIIDCNCQAHRGIDLYAAAFSRLAPLSAGELVVTLEKR